MKPLGYVIIASLLAAIVYAVDHVLREIRQRRRGWAIVGVCGLPGIGLMLYTMIRAAIAMPYPPGF